MRCSGIRRCCDEPQGLGVNRKIHGTRQNGKAKRCSLCGARASKDPSKPVKHQGFCPALQYLSRKGGLRQSDPQPHGKVVTVVSNGRVVNPSRFTEFLKSHDAETKGSLVGVVNTVMPDTRNEGRAPKSSEPPQQPTGR